MTKQTLQAIVAIGFVVSQILILLLLALVSLFGGMTREESSLSFGFIVPMLGGSIGLCAGHYRKEPRATRNKHSKTRKRPEKVSMPEVVLTLLPPGTAILVIIAAIVVKSYLPQLLPFGVFKGALIFIEASLSFYVLLMIEPLFNVSRE